MEDISYTLQRCSTCLKDKMPGEFNIISKWGRERLTKTCSECLVKNKKYKENSKCKPHNKQFCRVCHPHKFCAKHLTIFDLQIELSVL